MYEEDVTRLAYYLPIQAKDPRILRLIEHHQSHLLGCVKNELYSSSLVHLHILYMVFIYVQIQRIANFNKEAFKLSLIGFNREEKDLLKESNYPLLLSKVNEKTVFRFFRLNNIDDETISLVSEPVISRNNHLHANENIECETKEESAAVFTRYIKNMDTLLERNTNVFENIYTNLPNYAQLNEPDYELTQDDLELGVVLPGYFSNRELSIVTTDRTDKLSKKLREMYDLE